MIRIAPYYERHNKQEILEYHMNLVADVVPFRPEDVLGEDIPKASDSMSGEPRVRTDAYVAFLKKHGSKYGIIPNGNKKERRANDARLAEVLIFEYSEKLHNGLYGNEINEKYKNTITDDGVVKDKALLRELFTARLDHGQLTGKLKDIFPCTESDEQASDSENEPDDETKTNLLKYVFRYDEYSKKKATDEERQEKKHRDVYQLLSMLDVEVCPYCNRHFTSVVAFGKKRTRPQLDHYKCKKNYPYLALCINNLVPCCGVCNLIKHDDPTSVLYPYDEGMDDNSVFRAECDINDITSLLTGAGDATEKFKIKLKTKENISDGKYSKRINASIDFFALEELYQYHSDYVADLFFQRYIYTDDFFDATKIQFPGLFDSKEDVKHLVRLMDYSPDEWGKRPLAKLTHDIVEQIDELFKE